MTEAAMPITASGTRSAATAALKTRNFGQKPNSGGIPASENMNTASAAASPGRVRDRPESEAIVRSEELTSELQSLMRISYAVFCLKKKKIQKIYNANTNT